MKRPSRRSSGVKTSHLLEGAEKGSMSVEQQPIGECVGIDDEAIESYSLGRLEEGPIRQHIDICAACHARVAEHRAYLEDLKRGLKDL